MPDSESGPETRLELYVRSLLPRGSRETQEAALERLKDLESAGVVDEVGVVVWGRGLDTSSEVIQTDTGKEIRRRVDAFHEWAREQGFSLRTCFSSRQVRSHIVDEEYDAITFPAMAVAAFRDDDVEFVAPCTDGETTYTVTDLLDALEGDESVEESTGDPFHLPARHP